MKPLRVRALNVYPVKSMKGIAVRSWPVGETGLVADRRWLVVDQRGVQVTQREAPRMCLIAPAFEPVATAAPTTTGRGGHDPVIGAGMASGEPALATGDLVLSAPRAGSVTVSEAFVGPRVKAYVWAEEVDATASEPEVDAWLSDFLDRHVRLLRFKAAARQDGRPWQRAAFPDSLPFLLISQESLDDLNARLRATGEAPVEMDRFRPNLVVAGGEPFAEDRWRRIAVGGIDFKVVAPCARCTITTVEQATGKVGREPLRTLAGYRTTNRKVMFGQKLIHTASGRLAIGDPVEVRESVPPAELMTFEAGGEARSLT